MTKVIVRSRKMLKNNVVRFTVDCLALITLGIVLNHIVA